MSATTASPSDDGAGPAWAAAAVGSAVVAERPLTGGITSTMLALEHADGARTVLRTVDREPWARHREALTRREHETQRELAATVVPAPRSLALDAPAGRHLMSFLPGTADHARTSERDLRALAQLLAHVHDVRPAVAPRPYESWAWEAKHVVPDGATRPAVWEAAFALLRTDPPVHEPTFVHRDFHLGNVLWDGPRPSGLVDWVETSTGPAWLDVAHGATNLAVRHGSGPAERFAAAYTALTGRRREPYWEVMDVVGFLPPPGRAAFFTGPGAVGRLEQRLADALSEA